MHDDASPLSLDVRQQALQLSLRGARASVPLMWLVVGLVVWPGRHWPAAWPVWVLGSLGLISGLWRLHVARELDRLGDALGLDGVRRLERQVQANAALSGLMWAGATVILLPTLSAEQAALHVCLLIGSLAVASLYMSLIGRSFELIAYPIMVPLIGMAFWLGGPNKWMVATGAAVFLMAVLRATGHLRNASLLAMQRNQEIHAARARLDAEFDTKWRLLGTMSHEVRRPINGLKGALELLEHGELSAPQREWLQLARRSSDELLRTLTEWLDFARLETHPYQPSPEPLALAPWCEALVRPARQQAQAKGLQFELTVDPALPAHVLADGLALGQVLSRLLSNAVKFTERGTVRLSVATGPDRRVHFSVSDTGIGIAAADQASLFQPFRQVDQGPQRSHPGVGLGLATAQRLVASIGGRIQVQSQPAQGSVFSVALALPAAAQPEPPAADAVPRAPDDAPLRGVVLVAEDDEVNRLVTSHLLQAHGLTVVQALDGQQALKTMLRGGIDLVLMDGQMPVLDGYEATRQWRQLEQRLGQRHLPIVGLSANTQPEDVDLALRCGMDDHLAKPVSLDDLLGCLRRWMPATPGAPAQ